MNSLISELQKRGLISNFSEGIESKLKNKSTIFVGFDPTGDSLHIGSLMPLLLTKQCIKHGHEIIILLGSATANIGDPSGKSKERNILDPLFVTKNTLALQNQIKSFFSESELTNIRFVNNLDWFSGISFIDFLSNIGRHFKVNQMLMKDSVKRRLNSEEGISFTEFSYSLMQAFDFAHLSNIFDCGVQIGGSDQWGNIVSGIDLTKKLHNKEVHGLTFPLLTKSDGSKMGKTESGTIWLNPEKTSPFEFFQFWLNLTDVDAIRVLPWLSFDLSVEEINVLIENSKKESNRRLIQRHLAKLMTTMIHGEQVSNSIESASKAMFENEFGQTCIKDFLLIKDQVPHEFINDCELTIVDLLVKVGMLTSKSDARRLIVQNAIKINGQTEKEDRLIKIEDFIGKKILIIAKGKKERLMIIRT